MSKLGFVLRTTDSGEREILHINKDMLWADYISDTRQYIKALKKFDATGKIVYLLRFLGKRGYLFAIIKARPHGSGKPGDNTSAWIHIPAKSNISIDSLILVIRGVEREISAQDGINEIALKELFSHKYEEKNVLLTAVEKIISNEDGNIGYRYFGKGTGYELEEILGDELAQIEYKKYKGIFLINSQSEIEPSDHCVLVDKLNSISTITNPKVEKGYVAYIDDIKFSDPIEVTCPCTLNIILKKEGYKDIPKSLQIPQSNQIQNDWEIQIKSEDCLRCIQKAWFYVYDDENKEPLTSKISIKVDGQSFNDGFLYVAENLDSHHDVEIQCDGYKTYKDNIVINDNIHIGLTAEEHEEKFILPKQESAGLNADATIIIRTKKNSKSMPLKGYKVSENQLLRYDRGRSLKLKWFGAGVVSVIVLAVLCAICIVLYNNLFGTHHKEETTISEYEQIKTDTSVSENVDNIEMDNNKAIEYLNNNSVWAKDSLDNYEITKGLFEAMNELDLDLLTNKKYATLQDQCDNFRSIVNAANTCLDEKIDVQSLIKGRHYNSDPSDKKITVSKYIEWLQDVPNKVVQENITTEKSRITNKPKNNSNKASSTKSASTNKPNRNGAKVK